MLRKLVVVYDLKATNYPVVQREIIDPARKVQGFLVGKFVWQPVSFRENVRRLADFLHDGDLVVVAGGDALASMASNAIMLSKKDVSLAAFGYGATNDTVHLLRSRRPVAYGDDFVGGIEEVVRKFNEGRILEVYPLEIRINGKKWRYALNYASVGSLAKDMDGFLRRRGCDGEDESDNVEADEGVDTGGNAELVKRPKSYLGLKIRFLAWHVRFSRQNELSEAILKTNRKDSNFVKPVVEKVPSENTSDSEEFMLQEDVSLGNASLERVSSEKASFEKASPGESEKSQVLKEEVEFSTKSVKSSNKEVAKSDIHEIEAAQREADKVEAVAPDNLPDLNYEILISNESPRLGRGLAGILERIWSLRAEIYRRQFARRRERQQKAEKIVACAVEKHDEKLDRKPKGSADSLGAKMEEKTANTVEAKNETTEVNAGELLWGKSDVLAVNGLTFLGGLHGRRFYKNPDVFLLKTLNLKGFWRLFGFNLKGKLFRISGKKVTKAELNFLKEATVFVQTDNAAEKVDKVKKIEIRKAKFKFKLVRF